MPAVELDRLKLQSANLAGKISRPDLFLPMFRELLDAYSNRTFRPQNTPGRIKVTPSYHVPEKVLWQVERDLQQQIKVHTLEQCMELANRLWNSKSIEEKTLAVFILGNLHAEKMDQLADQFLAWYAETSDLVMQSRLATIGLRSIRENSTIRWNKILDGWISSGHTSHLISAINAVEDTLEISGDAFLPEAYGYLFKMIECNNTGVLQELLHLLQVLSKRSRSETAFFIKELAGKSKKMSGIVERVIKRSVVFFPPEMQKDLRKLVQNPEPSEDGHD